VDKKACAPRTDTGGKGGGRISDKAAAAGGGGGGEDAMGGPLDIYHESN